MERGEKFLNFIFERKAAGRGFRKNHLAVGDNVVLSGAARLDLHILAEARLQ
jgi:hypothetical protein